MGKKLINNKFMLEMYSVVSNNYLVTICDVGIPYSSQFEKISLKKVKNSLLGEGVKKLSNQFPDPKIVDKSSLKDIISGLSTSIVG